MKLRSLTPQNIGPFQNAKFTFEPDVTVITGRNDAGKSRLLRLIELTCGKVVSEAATEDDVNLDRKDQAAVPWDEDETIACQAEFDGVGEHKGKEIKYTSKLAPKLWQTSRIEIVGHTQTSGAAAKKFLPNTLLIRPGVDEGVRQELSIDTPNSTERRFLGVIFGPHYDAAAVSKFTLSRFQSIIAKGQETLNRRLRTMLPSNLPFTFQFTYASDNRDRLVLNLTDEHGSSTLLGQRGTGVQRMVSLLGRLAIENIGDKPSILLVDEPETSLHADAQHFLRQVLEQLGSLPHLQVIYATHSPCMVNCMRPQSLRVLHRVQHGDSGRTEMITQPFTANFACVRATLGMSPADSLMYAPVVIVVEGKTEVLALSILLRRLEAKGLDEFRDVSALMTNAIFLEATGTGNVPALCKMAEAQGSRVVAFCDGDTATRWMNVFQRNCPNVPLVSLPIGTELEEIIPRDSYFNALSKCIGEEAGIFTAEMFDEWLSVSTLHAKMAFTKKVERWVIDELKASWWPDKASVMKEASEEVDLDKLQLAELRELLGYVRKALA